MGSVWPESFLPGPRREAGVQGEPQARHRALPQPFPHTPTSGTHQAHPWPTLSPPLAFPQVPGEMSQSPQGPHPVADSSHYSNEQGSNSTHYSTEQSSNSTWRGVPHWGGASLVQAPASMPQPVPPSLKGPLHPSDALPAPHGPSQNGPGALGGDHRAPPPVVSPEDLSKRVARRLLLGSFGVGSSKDVLDRVFIPSDTESCSTSEASCQNSPRGARRSLFQAQAVQSPVQAQSQAQSQSQVQSQSQPQQQLLWQRGAGSTGPPTARGNATAVGTSRGNDGASAKTESIAIARNEREDLRGVPKHWGSLPWVGPRYAGSDTESFTSEASCDASCDASWHGSYGVLPDTSMHSAAQVPIPTQHSRGTPQGLLRYATRGCAHSQPPATGRHRHTEAPSHSDSLGGAVTMWEGVVTAWDESATVWANGVTVQGSGAPRCNCRREGSSEALTLGCSPPETGPVAVPAAAAGSQLFSTVHGGQTSSTASKALVGRAPTQPGPTAAAGSAPHNPAFFPQGLPASSVTSDNGKGSNDPGKGEGQAAGKGSPCGGSLWAPLGAPDSGSSEPSPTAHWVVGEKDRPAASVPGAPGAPPAHQGGPTSLQEEGEESLRALESKLALLSVQRQMSAVSCQSFLDDLEESLTATATEGAPPGCTPWAPGTPWGPIGNPVAGGRRSFDGLDEPAAEGTEVGLASRGGGGKGERVMRRTRTGLGRMRAVKSQASLEGVGEDSGGPAAHQGAGGLTGLDGHTRNEVDRARGRRGRGASQSRGGSKRHGWAHSNSSNNISTSLNSNSYSHGNSNGNSNTNSNGNSNSMYIRNYNSNSNSSSTRTSSSTSGPFSGSGGSGEGSTGAASQEGASLPKGIVHFELRAPSPTLRPSQNPLPFPSSQRAHRRNGVAHYAPGTPEGYPRPSSSGDLGEWAAYYAPGAPEGYRHSWESQGSVGDGPAGAGKLPGPGASDTGGATLPLPLPSPRRSPGGRRKSRSAWHEGREREYVPPQMPHSGPIPLEGRWYTADSSPGAPDKTGRYVDFYGTPPQSPVAFSAPLSSGPSQHGVPTNDQSPTFHSATSQSRPCGNDPGFVAPASFGGILQQSPSHHAAWHSPGSSSVYPGVLSHSQPHQSAAYSSSPTHCQGTGGPPPVFPRSASAHDVAVTATATAQGSTSHNFGGVSLGGVPVAFPRSVSARHAVPAWVNRLQPCSESRPLTPLHDRDSGESSEEGFQGISVGSLPNHFGSDRGWSHA